ncbi:MAG: CvpA family protein [Planctomycetia bacterium]|nr:CvpA family protein [Planctomycetia bacterium]
MLMLLAVSILQRFGDLIVGGVVLALVAFGVQNGLFLAVLTGMQALLALVFALAFADPLAALLTTFELPIVYAFPAAFGLLLVGTAVATRLAMGGYVPAEVVRFAPIIDKLGGALVGAVAGIILAGTLLIACSIAPVPEAFRLDGSTLGYDMGTRMLRTFARCVEPDDAKRAVLLDGEPGSVPEPSPDVAPAVLDAADTKGNAVAQQEQVNRDKPLDNDKQDKQDKKGKKAKPENPPPTPPAPPPPPPRWSEPFADLNGNKQHDDGEPYLDTDRDKAFTASLVVNDPNANGKRDIGLLERYRLHAWGRHVISVVALDELTAVQAAAGTPATESAPAAGASQPAK